MSFYKTLKCIKKLFTDTKRKRGEKEIKYYSSGEEVGPFKSIYTSCTGTDGNIGSVRAIPDILLIPLYHKIRIPFETIFDLVITFDSFLEKMRINKFLDIKERIEWDIFLATTNQFKKEIGILHKYFTLSETIP